METGAISRAGIISQQRNSQPLSCGQLEANDQLRFKGRIVGNGPGTVCRKYCQILIPRQVFQVYGNCCVESSLAH